MLMKRIAYSFPYAIGGAFFGEGTGRVWLDNINCNGTEDDIFKCKSTGWGATNCGHSKDVSIICGKYLCLNSKHVIGSIGA